jgi:hypothetical protein
VRRETRDESSRIFSYVKNQHPPHSCALDSNPLTHLRDKRLRNYAPYRPHTRSTASSSDQAAPVSRFSFAVNSIGRGGKRYTRLCYGDRTQNAGRPRDSTGPLISHNAETRALCAHFQVQNTDSSRSRTRPALKCFPNPLSTPYRRRPQFESSVMRRRASSKSAILDDFPDSPTR